MDSLRIVFAGTPDFAACSLSALLASHHTVTAVLTQPDRPAGRGRKLIESPVKQLATAHQLPVYQPESLKHEAAYTYLEALAPDVIIVVAYGLLVPQNILTLPRYGCINVHGSLLPRWRGAAPIQRAIAAGDHQTGVTIMAMEAGLDTGPMLAKAVLPITPEMTGGVLHDQLAELGAHTLVECLDRLPTLLAQAQPQPEEGVTYAHKLTKEEGEIDFSQSAADVHNLIRAFNPWPVAWTTLPGTDDAHPIRIRIWDATLPTEDTAATDAPPGTVLARDKNGLTVQCGDGAILITRIQLPDRKAMTLQDVLNGHSHLLQPGDRFLSHAPEPQR